MNERDAQQVVRMVESGWSCDFGTEGRTLWCQMLYPYTAEMATKAVAEMSKYPLPDNRFKPQASDLRAMILKLQADQRVRELPQHTDLGKRGSAAPEWAHVWYFCRHIRKPRNLVSFPQELPHVDPTSTMTQAEYEKLREEWIAAGKPKVSTESMASPRPPTRDYAGIAEDVLKETAEVEDVPPAGTEVP